MIFYQHYRKDYVNPYRTGVKIGNYNEDLFGMELKERYSNARVNPKMYVSETMDKYAWPRQRPKTSTVRTTSGSLNIPKASNFDLNIEVSTENLQDYKKLQEKSEFMLDVGNKVNEGQLYDGNQFFGPRSSKPTIKNDNESFLSKYQIKDSNQGINRHLMFGHGVQKNFNKTEYTTTYQLAMDNKERTDNFLDPHYKAKENFQIPVPQKFDDKDWNFRRFKIYDEFTKSYDTPMNLYNK